MRRRNFLTSITAAIVAPTTVLATPLAPVSLLQAKEVMVIDSSGYPGFGTSHPSQKLQVQDRGRGFLVPVIH